jgi:hypothetical protein
MDSLTKYELQTIDEKSGIASPHTSSLLLRAYVLKMNHIDTDTTATTSAYLPLADASSIQTCPGIESFVRLTAGIVTIS